MHANETLLCDSAVQLVVPNRIFLTFYETLKEIRERSMDPISVEMAEEALQVFEGE